MYTEMLSTHQGIFFFIFILTGSFNCLQYITCFLHETICGILCGQFFYLFAQNPLFGLTDLYFGFYILRNL